MSESPEENSAIEQLLAERDALHGWLERLDAASVSASESVRARVRQDYQARLDLLTSALREHGDAIARKLSKDIEEQAELTLRTTSSRDALAEAELRHAVGEFPEDRFVAEQRRHRSDIEAFELSLAAVNDRIARMEDVLGQVRRAPRLPDLGTEVGFNADEVDAAVAIADLAPADPPESAGAEIVVEAEVVELPATSDEEADQLLTIFDAGEVAEAPPTSATPGFGPLSFRPSPEAPTRDIPPIGLPVDSVPRFVRPGDRLQPMQPSRPEPAAAPERGVPEVISQVQMATDTDSGIFSQEIVATGPVSPPIATGAGRTLRCGECGAMNRPLEWYCEKCGAELSAV